jgi:uncharacterized UPF0160 family protein
MINVVKERPVNNNTNLCVGTHNGMFHCDEVVAVAILSLIFKNIGDTFVIRTRDLEHLRKNTDILVDIGGGEFDHHQKGGNGKRENGIKYASAGLVWREFGYRLVESLANNMLTPQEISIITEVIDKDLLQNVDIVDNGQFDDVTHAFQFIDSFLPSWYRESNYDEKFEQCVNVVSAVLENVIRSNISLYLAKKGNVAKVDEENNQKVQVDEIIVDALLSILNKEDKESMNVELAWEKYGKEIVELISDGDLTPQEINIVTDNFNKDIIHGIGDNGKFTTGHPLQFIVSFLPNLNSDEKVSECVNVTSAIFENVIRSYIALFLAKKELASRYDNPETRLGNILVIPCQTIPWRDIIIDYNDSSDTKIDFVVFPYPDGGYALQCVPKSKILKTSQRISLPVEWAGESKKLPEISGIQSAILCHNVRFFARAGKYDDIIQMCNIATKRYLDQIANTESAKNTL